MTKIKLFSCYLLFFLFCLSCDNKGNPNGVKLLSCAEKGDIAGMEDALKTGVDINFISTGMLGTQQTPCAKAALNGHLEAVQWLVAKGADLHRATSGQENPISLAGKNNHFDIVFYLIEEGEDKNYQEKNYGMTPLMYAAEHGNLEAAKKLLAMGADHTLKNKEKEFAMTIAIKRRNPKVIEHFLDKGIEFRFPLHTVARFQNDTPLRDRDIQTLNLLLNRGADINRVNADGYTPLHIASMWSNDSLMQYLISKGADRSIQTTNGMSVQQLYGYHKQ